MALGLPIETDPEIIHQGKALSNRVLEWLISRKSGLYDLLAGVTVVGIKDCPHHAIWRKVESGLVLGINYAEWLSTVPASALYGWLEHAIAHLVLGHMNQASKVILERLTLRDGPEGMVLFFGAANLMADMAISHPVVMEEAGYTPFRWPANVPKTLESAVLLMRRLIQVAEESDSTESLFQWLRPGIAEFDPGFEDLTMRQLIDKAKKEASTFTASLTECLNPPKTDPDVEWVHEVLHRLQSACRIDRVKSWRRKNRRRPEDWPGRRSVQRPDVVLILDTSASMKDPLLRELAVSTQYLVQHLEEATLIHADCEVHQCELLTPRELLSTFHGRGGTVFEPALRFVMERYPTVQSIVYLTDGGGEEHVPFLPEIDNRLIWGLIRQPEVSWSSQVTEFRKQTEMGYAIPVNTYTAEL